jgi:hypothetical protein
MSLPRSVKLDKEKDGTKKKKRKKEGTRITAFIMRYIDSTREPPLTAFKVSYRVVIKSFRASFSLLRHQVSTWSEPKRQCPLRAH